MDLSEKTSQVFPIVVLSDFSDLTPPPPTYYNVTRQELKTSQSHWFSVRMIIASVFVFLAFLSIALTLLILVNYCLFIPKYTTILISMDGFRHDYIEIVKKQLGSNSLKNFDRLIQSGTRAMKSLNVYPTITLPNHQTLVTGLYAQHHGIVGNIIKDEKYSTITFSMNDQNSLNNAPWLTDWPEPIWLTLQRSGGLAGSLLWPMTDQLVRNVLPFQTISQFTMLNNLQTEYYFQKRIQDMLWWLDNPYFHLDLILAYFSEPDECGHAHGPYSSNVAKQIQELDKYLGQLLDGIELRNLTNHVNIILTSDHGMSLASEKKKINLDNYIAPGYYTYTELSTCGFLYPLNNSLDMIYNALKFAHPNLQVYRTSEVPNHLHFNISNNSRMPPLILIPDPLWYIENKRSHLHEIGVHGYDSNFTEMHPFFIASGPSFAVNKTTDTVHAVDIYPLMCSLLGIAPNPNNGSLNRISNILKPKVEKYLTKICYASLRKLLQKINLNYSFILFLLCTTTILMMSLLLIMYSQRLTEQKYKNHDELKIRRLN